MASEIKVRKEHYDMLTEYAELTGRSISEIIDEALTEYINDSNKHNNN